LSDSENDWGSDEEGGGKGGPGADDATMGKRRGGELGVNKKGTPLYSREDIREQYCINDKELQVLDRQASKGLFGCFSNQGQVRSFYDSARLIGINGLPLDSLIGIFIFRG